jgi:hypothetical protein
VQRASAALLIRDRSSGIPYLRSSDKSLQRARDDIDLRRPEARCDHADAELLSREDERRLGAAKGDST